MRFTLPIQVTSADIDELGHVSNQVYLRWVLEVALAHSSHVGWNHAQYKELGGIFIVRRHELDYLAQVTEGEALVATTWVETWRGASCIRMTEIARGDQIVARAATTWVFMGFASGRPQRMPADLVALFTG